MVLKLGTFSIIGKFYSIDQTENITLRPVLEKRSLHDLVVGSRFSCCNNPIVLVSAGVLVLKLGTFSISYIGRGSLVVYSECSVSCVCATGQCVL